MDLAPFVDTVRRELAVAAEAGGPEARALAERLAAPLGSALRLTLLDALATAAAEITSELAPGSVELRLRAGEAAFAVTPPPAPAPAGDDGAEAAGAAGPTEPAPIGEPDELGANDEDAAMVRINLRLPEHLKVRIEQAAAEEGRSVNAWLVRAATAALQPARTAPAAARGRRRGSGQRFTGWVS